MNIGFRRNREISFCPEFPSKNMPITINMLLILLWSVFLQIVSNTEIWDLRTFRLLKTVPALDQCSIMFSPTASVIYAAPLLPREPDDDIPLDTSFKTFDSYDYSSIGMFNFFSIHFFFMEDFLVMDRLTECKFKQFESTVSDSRHKQRLKSYRCIVVFLTSVLLCK